MDIGATYKGKGKGKGKNKGKRMWQRQQGKRIPTKKRLWRLRRIQQRKSQRKTTTMVPAKGMPSKGKGKNPTALCYRCGQPGHMAKDCRTAVYNMSETPQERNQDVTAQ